jgi:hypothetical protein
MQLALIILPMVAMQILTHGSFEQFSRWIGGQLHSCASPNLGPVFKTK